MKNLLHNIQTLAMLAFMMVGIQSCSDDWQEASDVQVNFTAILPTDTHTRSFGKAEKVNTLVVGVFDEQQKEIFRQSFPVSGSVTDVQLTLAQHQTYNFVFWAYDDRQDSYDMEDLTSIKMGALSDPITFFQAESMDAFFAIQKGVTIKGDSSRPVSLVRPLAQINIGTTGKPMQASFTAKDVPDTFHPFTNEVSGTTDFTWNFSETITGTFTADGTEYNYLAMGYLFAPTTARQTEATLTLGDKTFNFPQVEIEANQRSNIAGKFTTE